MITAPGLSFGCADWLHDTKIAAITFACDLALLTAIHGALHWPVPAGAPSGRSGHRAL